MAQNTEEKTKERKSVICVDLAIDAYNEKHPNLKPMSRKELAIRIGRNKQCFSDWLYERTPKLIDDLRIIMELSGLTFDELVKSESELKELGKIK